MLIKTKVLDLLRAKYICRAIVVLFAISFGFCTSNNKGAMKNDERLSDYKDAICKISTDGDSLFMKNNNITNIVKFDVSYKSHALVGDNIVACIVGVLYNNDVIVSLNGYVVDAMHLKKKHIDQKLSVVVVENKVYLATVEVQRETLLYKTLESDKQLIIKKDVMDAHFARAYQKNSPPRIAWEKGDIFY